MIDLIFTKELLENFKKYYYSTVLRDQKSFSYHGHEYGIELAKEIIEYFESKLETSVVVSGMFVT